MSKFKYYYRVNSKGEPIIGSNIKATKRPNGSKFREIIPQSFYCCNPEVVPPSSTGKRTKFFVRLNEEKNPITGSLRKYRALPNWGSFQEVVPYCCIQSVLTVTPNSVEILQGNSTNLSVEYQDKQGNVDDVTTTATYTSGDTDVATVSASGQVTGVSEGATTITVTFDGVSQVVQVVISGIAVTGISTTPPTLNTTTGSTQQLTTTFTPTNASNQGLTYSSSATGVATVSSTGLITAVAAGTATITVTSDDGGFTDTCVVTVV